MSMVAREGFEPSVEDPKSSALPLGHRAANLNTTPAGSGGVTSRRPLALGLVMKNVLLAALVFATAACGAYQFPGGTAASGTVTGQVTVIPCGPGPVEPAQPDFAPCKMKPAAGLEINFAFEHCPSEGAAAECETGKVTSTETDPNGRYKIDLPEGTYRVSVKNYMRVISGPPTVTIKARATVVADYVLDSGIRTAVPQQ
jgi:hypothetical protein